MKSAVIKEIFSWGISVAATVAFLAWWSWLWFRGEGFEINWYWLLPLIFGSFIARIILWLFRLLKTQWLTVQDSNATPPSENASVRRVILQLRVRANRLRIIAAFCLLLILVSLSGGLYVFSRAETSANRAEVERALFIAERLSRYKIDLDDIDREIGKTTDQIKLKELEDQRKTLALRIDSLTGEFRDATTSQTAFLVTVLSTKIGSALTLLFLVQILVTLYRYNIKVASFYDGRADALQLVSLTAIQDLQAVSAILATDKLDFGKMPTTPAQHAIDVAKELLSLTRRA